jgi:hypothetical protein
MGLFTEAQISENFNDGDFTNNPTWSGDTSDFILNSSLQLQSNDTVANSNFFLSAPNSLATSAEWEMYIQIAFNPSSANYIDIYLTASAGDLTLNTTTGYFVRIGNTDDEISLYRKDASGAVTKIIDGLNGILNNSNNVMKIKVIKDAANQWILSRDLSGTGNAYTSEGSVIDATYTSCAFFGFLIKQSTSSFFKKHFFDDIEIKNYVPDVTSPVIQSATAISSTAVDVLFDEPVETASSQLVTNYSANNSLGNPATAVLDGANTALVHLTYTTPFTNAVVYTLMVNGVADLSGNTISNGTVTFNFYTPQRYDVVIDEIMADPSPQVGLPDSKWLELKNTSAFAINLQEWQLSNNTGQKTGAMPNFILQPDSFVIVCTGSAVPGLAPYGNVISVTNFPSLDIGGYLVSLYSATGQTIHAVQYTSDWYQNELKKDGGWTLEMIDTKNPCSGISNWKASTDVSGGTPGRKNSIDGINTDATAPNLLRVFAVDNTTITLVYDEPLDSLKAATVTNYAIDNGINTINATAVSPVFDKVNITLNIPIVAGTIYTVTAANVTDCKGNVIGSKNSARFGIAQDADSLDLVINEILYNPKPGGVDYVELYNRSQKIIDLSHVYIANRSSGVISNIQQTSVESILLFPGDFMVLTSDPTAVKNQYITTNPDAFITVNSMPSFSDDAGNVIILNGQGNIVDEVDYLDKWQFPLISNTEGVSLERIDYNGASVQSNFHSAATSVGYGTPGYKNSQYRLNADVSGTITVTPDVFSPDNDGTDDFATINYSFPSPGYVANITIFDASGHAVRYLQKNSLSSIKGYYRWDGLDDKNQKLPQGIYIIYTEIFNTAGKKKQFKNTIVLARKYQ